MNSRHFQKTQSDSKENWTYSEHFYEKSHKKDQMGDSLINCETVGHQSKEMK